MVRSGDCCLLGSVEECVRVRMEWVGWMVEEKGRGFEGPSGEESCSNKALRFV